MAKLSFFGAVRGVTGSCHLLEVGGAKFLFDCGMFQGSENASEYNLEVFGFDPKEIKAVFVTHPHADHVGRLPKLVKEGFNGKIYMVSPCRPLSRLVLEDAAHIMEGDAKKHGTSILFTSEDVVETFNLVETVNYHENVDSFPGISVMFHNAGHVLGSSFISVDFEGKRLVFSGDIGNDDVPILPDTEDLSKADYVVCESTYGDRVHEGTEQRSEKLRAAILSTIENKGVLLIPSFSIERTQELLYEMDMLLEHELKVRLPIFLDSPMAIRATQTYRDFKHYLKFDKPITSESDSDFFSFKGLKETLLKKESMVINNSSNPKIIIAGSGMMSGGRIQHHLLRYLDKKTTTVLIIGYQAEGTLGRKIQDGAKMVQIFGNDVEVNAKIEKIESFSAHGDRDKLTRWLQPTEGPVEKKIILVHGDADQKLAFKKHLDEKLKTEVLIPGFGEVIEL